MNLERICNFYQSLTDLNADNLKEKVSEGHRLLEDQTLGNWIANKVSKSFTNQLRDEISFTIKHLTQDEFERGNLEELNAVVLTAIRSMSQSFAAEESLLDLKTQDVLRQSIRQLSKFKPNLDILGTIENYLGWGLSSDTRMVLKEWLQETSGTDGEDTNWDKLQKYLTFLNGLKSSISESQSFKDHARVVISLKQIETLALFDATMMLACLNFQENHSKEEALRLKALFDELKTAAIGMTNSQAHGDLFLLGILDHKELDGANYPDPDALEFDKERNLWRTDREKKEIWVPAQLTTDQDAQGTPLDRAVRKLREHEKAFAKEYLPLKKQIAQTKDPKKQAELKEKIDRLIDGRLFTPITKWSLHIHSFWKDVRSAPDQKQPFISGTRVVDFYDPVNARKETVEIPLDLSPLGSLDEQQTREVLELINSFNQLGYDDFEWEKAIAEGKGSPDGKDRGDILKFAAGLGFTSDQQGALLKIAAQFHLDLAASINKKILAFGK